MAFTYTEDLTVDADYVRFHTGDVDSDTHLLSDAIITSLLAVEASKEEAVIAGLRHKILLVMEPDFEADWLKVSTTDYVKALERRVADKQKELGIGGVRVTSRHVYRADSAATEAPDYSDGT